MINTQTSLIFDVEVSTWIKFEILLSLSQSDWAEIVKYRFWQPQLLRFLLTKNRNSTNLRDSKTISLNKAMEKSLFLKYFEWFKP